MKITLKQLKTLKACEDGVLWFKNQKNKEVKYILRKLITEKQFNWANWYVTKLFTQPQAVLYSIYCAEQSLSQYEQKYSNDLRPRQAIEVAKQWVINPTEENKSAVWFAAESAARSAESAAWSAAESAGWSAAESAARSAESAVWSAARSAAESAGWSAQSAVWSAESAAWSAAESAVWSAARSAESAVWSAESAARSAAWSAIIEKAIEILGL